MISEYFDPLQAQIPHTYLHTLPDDRRSMSQKVTEKHYDSRHDKLKNSTKTTELTNTNIFQTICILLVYFVTPEECLCFDLI